MNQFVQVRKAVSRYCKKDHTDKKALRAALENDSKQAAARLYPFAGKQTFPTLQVFEVCLAENTESALQMMKFYRF